MLCGLKPVHRFQFHENIFEIELSKNPAENIVGRPTRFVNGFDAVGIGGTHPFHRLCRHRIKRMTGVMRNSFMMSSKSRQNAEEILDVVFELLDDYHLYETIDEPIEKAFASFAFDIKTPVTHDYFIEITSRFVRHIYQQGLFIRQKLSISQASSETIALLEDGYQSPYKQGTMRHIWMH